jgi:hypothetical protein
VLPQASLRCNVDTRSCELAECAPGFADCNGDASAYTGQPGSDGCEYNFGPNGELRGVPELLEVPQVLNIDIADGERGDWTGIPAYPLLATCDNCVDQSLPEVTASSVVPARGDLEAYFRVAWNDGFFYLLGDVFDANLISDGPVAGQCQNGSLCEDAFAVLFDGRNNRAEQPSPNIDDLYVFIGTGGNAYRISNRVPEPGELDFKATPNGAACYRIEAQFSWAYVTGAQNGQAIAGQFPPVIGQHYGFDVAVNDWDPGVSDPAPQRESQLFWVNPQDGYQQNTSNFGPMLLTAGVAGGSGAPQ